LSPTDPQQVSLTGATERRNAGKHVADNAPGAFDLVLWTSTYDGRTARTPKGTVGRQKIKMQPQNWAADSQSG